KGVIANPNCSTIITLMAIYGINQLSKIEGIIASTYQAVSGAGVKGIAALQNEVENYVKNNEVIKSGNAFEYPIAFNCIPKIGSFNDNGYTSEEMKMENEGRKIMHLPDLKVTCTCVRVPVMRSHCISVTVITEDKLSLQDVRNKLSQTAGIILKENVGYPMPYTASDKDMVEVGRIREDRVLTNGISLWCCGDQIRKGAASNAIQIMETLAKM
ncbi:MAG: aspartate-semialdehyde dehydrogenase, partial [Firmicutes bacterium]|nr:aspartate-semialdehyde dehydrogenase [Bacillota bacterium]